MHKVNETCPAGIEKGATTAISAAMTAVTAIIKMLSFVFVSIKICPFCVLSEKWCKLFTTHSIQ